MIIDFHTHIVPPQLKEDRSLFNEKDPNFSSLYSSPKAKLCTADELVESMDKEGIDKSITLGIGTKNAPVATGGTGTVEYDDIGLAR